jgi:hypothetical protein
VIRFLSALALTVLAVSAAASDCTITLSGDSPVVCGISFSAEAESVDGTHPLKSEKIINFARTITEADPDLVLDENDLQYPTGIEYKVSGGKLVDSDNANTDRTNATRGTDRFVFAPGSGLDTIVDFENDKDVIDVSGYLGIANFGDIQPHAAQVGTDVTIDFGVAGVDVLTVTKFSLADLGANDFEFA